MSELKKLAEAFSVMEDWETATITPILVRKLSKAVLVMREALVACSNHCVCERYTTIGFDYGEQHAKLGKPKIGVRWVTPSDIAAEAIADAEKIANGK